MILTINNGFVRHLRYTMCTWICVGKIENIDENDPIKVTLKHMQQNGQGLVN